VPYTLRRRERRHNPSRPILFTQRCVRQMGRWSSLQKESTSAKVASLHNTITYGSTKGKPGVLPVNVIHVMLT
jgi:hypothetical protein